MVLASTAVGLAAIIVGSVTDQNDCEESRLKMGQLEVRDIKVLDNFGKIRKISSHIADDPAEQANGYQFICQKIISESAMLFVYPGPVNRRFHMQNVKAPLDIGFFDANGGLFSTMIMDTYTDGNQRTYGPDRLFQYALEAPAGFFEANHLSPRKARLVIDSSVKETSPAGTDS